MAVGAKVLEAASEPLDAPPAYEQAITSSSSSSARAPALKPVPTPTSPRAVQLGLGAPRGYVAASRGGWASSWLRSFGLGEESKTDSDVKSTVLLLVRDLVKAGHSPDALSILQSCAEACRARGLSFEAILQEPSIEGHTPLYWAILKSTGEGQLELVDLLMSFPLTGECVRDARLACLLASDDALFQCLRRSPACSSVTDELLLGAPPEDRVTVENAPGDHGAFKVALHFAQFQRRMRVSKAVRAEFIARGRIWSVSFLVAREHEHVRHTVGTWLAVVGLVDAEVTSPPTHLDARIVIQGPVSSATLRLQSSDRKIGDSDNYDGTRRHRAIAPLAETGLEFDGCPLVNPDGSLEAVFEAELIARNGTDSGCVIV